MCQGPPESHSTSLITVLTSVSIFYVRILKMGKFLKVPQRLRISLGKARDVWPHSGVGAFALSKAEILSLKAPSRSAHICGFLPLSGPRV